jgi:DMSO/TMAO reductase YedYZ molybdopterin-dependent catalytic subunit
VKSKEDQGHDTKVAPSADTAEKMAPASMVAGEKIRQERAGRMPRGLEEAGRSRSTLNPGTSGLLLTMDDILKLPKHDLVTQFKCIEGWSQIVHWGGVRMADLIAAYPPAKTPDGRLPRYVYMETPNGDYYVGYDLKLCMHPQTLLVTEMGGSPLTQFHGAPLRLHAPTKYGYKQIKRIGLIAYTDQQPDDYWTKLGYDWYAGL